MEVLPLLLLLFASGFLGFVPRVRADADSGSLAVCHCLPGDECWPSAPVWDAFNASVGGRLIGTVPVGAVCHEPMYDEDACEALRANWNEPDVHYKSSSSPMTRYWSNNTCNPFAAPSSPCTLGNLISYAVNVTTATHIATTIAFARDHNIRFLVHNTGHDFQGRSTGAGALAVWTHHLKSPLEFIPDYSSLSTVKASSYRGPAIRIPAGAQGSEVVDFAAQHGLVVVAGWCPSVGLAGGFVQGAGHSPLGSVFGMAADQTLEFEVVTARGDVVRAAPDDEETASLYWALSGGGPGTYGVVSSVVVRAYADLPVGGVGVYMNASTSDGGGGSRDAYWESVAAWWGLLPDLNARGWGATFAYTNASFNLVPLTAYNASSADVRAALRPWTDVLDRHDIAYVADWTDSDGYGAHWKRHVAPGPVGTFWQSGSRIIHTQTLVDPGNFSRFVDVARRLVEEEGVSVGGTMIAPVKRTVGFDNAVLPAWRSAQGLFGMLKPWSDDPDDFDAMKAQARDMSARLLPLLKSVTGGKGAGCYMNEGDYADPEWRAEFFGVENYARLLRIKEEWDPEGVFWGRELVGSERWVVDGVEDGGRMCRGG